MPTIRRIATVAAALAAAATLGSSAAAEPHSGVDAQLYKPALDAFGVWSLESATGLKRHDFSLKLGVGYSQTPMSMPVPGIGATADDESTDAALDFALNFNMTAAFAFTERLSFGLDVGIFRTATDDGYGERGRYADAGSEPSSGLISLRPTTNIDPSGGFEPHGLAGPTDVRVGAKYRLITGGKLGVALIGTVAVPFGDEEMFLGDDSFVFSPKLAVEYGLGENSRLVANVGAVLRNRTVLEVYNAGAAMPETEADAKAVIDVGSEIVAGVGALYEIAPQLIIAAEASVFMPLPENTALGTCELNSGMKCSTLEADDYFADAEYGDPAALAMLGLNYRATPDTSLSIGGGAGGFLGDGRGEDFRVMGGVIWSPTPEGTRVIGRGDADGDGVPDRIDICPDEPEDNDGYQDDDGCPDLDNDGDGVIDAQDTCPDEPEDKDGYKDDDGCPEKDNDGDGVADVTDRCPNDPEDLDKYEDDDGCPDEDNDGDGIADAKDQCPNEAETVNGVDDLDGCPDEDVAGGVEMDPTRINLKGARIKFAGRSANLTKADKQILDDIAVLLTKDYPNARIRIEVHSKLGTKSKNRRTITKQKRKDKVLTGKRADAVRTYLGKKGVAGGRLQAAGLGSDLPLEPAAPTAESNDRVDFIRTEQR
jgi:outer membrane protein OmpA-like peptidoglycan-associated protein